MVRDFDINRYLGNWYEIARLPNRFEDKCIAPIIAKYSIDSENNTQIKVANTCNTKENQPDIAYGVASFVESSNVGKLKVSFVPQFLRLLNIGYGDYWVLNVDYNKIAVVGSPDHEYLWILSRTEKVDKNTLDCAIKIAQDMGYNVNKIIFNYQNKD